MNKCLLGVVAACASLFSIGNVCADQGARYLPLQVGNSWTFQNVQTHGQSTMTVASRSGDFFYLSGFPAKAGGVWATFSGDTLYAWNSAGGSWQGLFRFGAAVGTTYTVSLDNGAWKNVHVKVLEKGANVFQKTLQQSFAGCTRFGFEFPGASGAGIASITFAPDFGPTDWTDTSSPWPALHWIWNAVISGGHFGAVHYSVLESGPVTSYAIAGTDRLKLIKTRAAWRYFYAQHKPGVPAPSIDFSTHTVLVVLAGERPTSGYELEVDFVKWNYPGSTVGVTVVENLPGSPAADGVTSPYMILVLDAKPSWASADWQTADPPDPD